MLTDADVCCRMLSYDDGSAKPASLAQLLPHAERESAVALERTCPPTRGRLARVAAEGTHFTYFAGTKVQILEICGAECQRFCASARTLTYADVC